MYSKVNKVCRYWAAMVSLVIARVGLIRVRRLLLHWVCDLFMTSALCLCPPSSFFSLVVLSLSPLSFYELNWICSPTSYDGARVLEASGCPISSTSASIYPTRLVSNPPTYQPCQILSSGHFPCCLCHPFSRRLGPASALAFGPPGMLPVGNTTAIPGNAAKLGLSFKINVGNQNIGSQNIGIGKQWWWLWIKNPSIRDCAAETISTEKENPLVVTSTRAAKINK